MSWVKEAREKANQIRAEREAAGEAARELQIKEREALLKQANEIIKLYSPIIESLMDDLRIDRYPVAGPLDGMNLDYDSHASNKPKALISEGYTLHADHSGYKYYCRSWWPFSEQEKSGMQVALVPLEDNRVELRVEPESFNHSQQRHIITDPNKFETKLLEILSEVIHNQA